MNKNGSTSYYLIIDSQMAGSFNRISTFGVI